MQQEIAQAAQTVVDYPPMQKGASFNLEAMKQEAEKPMASHAGQRCNNNGGEV